MTVIVYINVPDKRRFIGLAAAIACLFTAICFFFIAYSQSTTTAGLIIGVAYMLACIPFGLFTILSLDYGFGDL